MPMHTNFNKISVHISSIKLGVLMFFSMLLMGALWSCEPDRKKPKTLSEIKAYEEPLQKVNQILLKQDEAKIRAHCERRAWSMQMTPSGMWYGKLKSSELDSVKRGDFVNIKFSVSLLGGKVLYSSDSMGTKTFEVGHGGVESGLEEGILLMCNREKYRFILPPHKAHGLLGDLNKIPARSIIVYEVEIIDILNH